jgi:hypothetical protein
MPNVILHITVRDDLESGIERHSSVESAEFSAAFWVGVASPGEVEWGEDFGAPANTKFFDNGNVQLLIYPEPEVLTWTQTDLDEALRQESEDLT